MTVTPMPLSTTPKTLVVRPGESVAAFRKRNADAGLLTKVIWDQWLARQAHLSIANLTHPEWKAVKLATAIETPDAG